MKPQWYGLHGMHGMHGRHGCIAQLMKNPGRLVKTQLVRYN